MKNEYLRWLSRETPTVWWHDSGNRREVMDACENGAAGLTTNPYLIAETLCRDGALWADALGGFDKTLAGDAKAIELERRVAGSYASRFAALRAAGDFRKGGVCAQVSPARLGDAALMIEQMKRIAAFAPNMWVKLPGTRAGLAAFEEGIFLGFNVVCTVSFTVPQAIAAAKAQRRGEERAARAGVKPGNGMGVIMAGRLDDYLRDVVKDNGLPVAEGDITQAGLACVKRAHEIYRERGYNTALLPAALRGAHHVTELAGAGGMVLSIAPAIQTLLLEQRPRHEERIDVPVPPEVIERLMRIPDFRRAYDEDGMTEDEFITFGPTNRTAAQFIESGWNRLLAYEL